MKFTILHNPRCSKSRKTLEILQSEGIEPNIVRYLETPPSAGELVSIAVGLGQPLQNLLRRGEAAFKEATDLPALDDDDALAVWMSANPIVIERPVVIRDDGQARIGRPPEAVLELLGRG